MKTLPAMEVRKHFGAVIDEVRMKSEIIILERAGKPVAIIQSFSAESAKEKSLDQRLNALTRLSGLGVEQPRAKQLDAWLDAERDGWDRV